MRHLETASINGSIASTLLCHTYTADRARLIFMRVFVSAVAGGGDYTAYLTIQRAGAGAAFYVVPLTVTPVDSGYGAICLTTIAIPINQNDVVRTYLLGLPQDAAVGVVTEVWEDDSNFNAPATTYPTGTLGHTLWSIGSSPIVRVEVPLMDTSKLQIVRGDDYVASHGTGIVLESSQWPDLTGATVQFLTETLVTRASVLGTQQVLIELTNEQTELLQSGYFSLVATFQDGSEVSLVPKAKMSIITRVV